MFKSRNYIDIEQIPSDWIFSYYLKLPKLKGGSTKMKSIFNEKDTTPSLYIFYNVKLGKYTYKCFSSGKTGNAVGFFMASWKMSFQDTIDKITKDFIKYCENHDYESIMENELVLTSWRVTSLKKRKWNEDDMLYWNEYHITEEMLNKHNIIPLSFYEMSLIEGDTVIENFKVQKKRIYGYFKKQKEELILAKIYQPGQEKKFLKIDNYLQGTDQNGKEDFMIIASSLKDIMALKTIGVKAAFCAPDSENTFIDVSIIKKFKKAYKAIITIFDNDTAGIKAMQEYKSKFDINFCYLPFEKDPAEILKTHGIYETQLKIIPKLNNALNK